MTERNGQTGTLLSIQALRGIAALLVVVFHAGLRFDQTEMTFRTGNAGVDIFFVVSGFIMWTVTARRPTAPFAFLRQRFIRLVPMYWIFTLVTLAVWVVVPREFPHMHPTLQHYLLSLAFIPHVSPDTGLVMPALGQGWTLNFEVFFYILFTIVLALPARRRLGAIAAALLVLPAAGVFVKTPAVPVTTLLDPLLIEFLGGIGIAVLVVGGVQPRAAWCWAGVAAGVVLLALAAPGPDDDAARLVQYGVPACLLVGGMVGAELCGSLRVGALPRWLGDASYSIYLSHTLVISAVGKIWPLALPNWLFLAAATLASALAGVAVYVIVERPLLGFLRGRRSPRIALRTGDKAHAA